MFLFLLFQYRCVRRLDAIRSTLTRPVLIPVVKLNDFFDKVAKEVHAVSVNGVKLTLHTAFQYILKGEETAAKSAKSAETLALALGNCKVFYGLGGIWMELGGSMYTSPENYVEHLSLDAGAPARAALRALNKQFAPTTTVPNKTPPSSEATPSPSSSEAASSSSSSSSASASSSASSAKPSTLSVVTQATSLPLSKSSSSSSSSSSPPILPFLLKECRAWSKSDVADWLSSLGLSDYGPAFTYNEIDGAGLLHLSNDDLDYLKVVVCRSFKTSQNNYVCRTSA